MGGEVSEGTFSSRVIFAIIAAAAAFGSAGGAALASTVEDSRAADSRVERIVGRVFVVERPTATN